MNDTWHDNRPFDRPDRGFLLTSFGVTLAIAIPLSALNYFIALLWASEAFAFAYAIGFGILGFTPFVSSFVNASRFPALIRFNSQGMTWKTNRGKTYAREYTAVLMIVPSLRKRDWAGGKSKKYHVYLPGRTRIGRWAIALTPENRERLDAALEQLHRAQSLSPRPNLGP